MPPYFDTTSQSTLIDREEGVDEKCDINAGKAERDDQDDGTHSHELCDQGVISTKEEENLRGQHDIWVGEDKSGAGYWGAQQQFPGFVRVMTRPARYIWGGAGSCDGAEAEIELW
jgi:hypothetical protein